MSHIFGVFTRYPLLRGMASYSIIWPVSAFIQQKIAGKEFDSIDWWKCARFSFFGGFYVAATFYLWVRTSGKLFPQNNLRSAVYKALLEQVSYTPAAMTSFYFLMSLLEGRSIDDGINEVKTKFLPTYKAALCIWSAVSTFNFSVVPEKNRVVFMSMCSLLWTCFLAYMKQLENKNVQNLSNELFEHDKK